MMWHDRQSLCSAIHVRCGRSRLYVLIYSLIRLVGHCRTVLLGLETLLRFLWSLQETWHWHMTAKFRLTAICMNFDFSKLLSESTHGCRPQSVVTCMYEVIYKTKMVNHFLINIIIHTDANVLHTIFVHILLFRYVYVHFQTTF